VFAKPLVRDSHQRLELPVEANVVLIKQAQVLDVVLQQGHPLDSESPGVPGVTVWVDSTVAQDLRMDHAATAGRQPSGPTPAAATLAEAASAHRVALVARLRVAEMVGP